MKFPKFSQKYDALELVKVKSSKGSVMVSNEQALEYAHNQFLEGAESVDIVTPDGKIHNRTFVKESADRTNSILGNRHDPRIVDKKAERPDLYSPQRKEDK